MLDHAIQEEVDVKAFIHIWHVQGRKATKQLCTNIDRLDIFITLQRSIVWK